MPVDIRTFHGEIFNSVGEANHDGKRPRSRKTFANAPPVAMTDLPSMAAIIYPRLYNACHLSQGCGLCALALRITESWLLVIL